MGENIARNKYLKNKNNFMIINNKKNISGIAVEAVLDQRSKAQEVKPASRISGDSPTGAPVEASLSAPELAVLSSTLEEVRTEIERLEKIATARQGKWARGLTNVAFGWCVMSGVYVAGFWP